MKRFGLGEDMADSVDMAGVLMVLSRGRGGEPTKSSSSSSSSRVFECKTCNRQFPSFQALGGHRASHKKMRPVPPEADGGKQKVHGCSICGVEFAVGQALGGHMRRHRPAEGGAGSVGIVGGEKRRRRRRVWLDLNLPPSMSTEDEMECRKTGFGLENIVDPIPMVDCLY